MEIIQELIPITVFVIGFFMGFKIGKEDKLPNLNPVTIVKEKIKEEEEAKEAKELEEYLEQIESYPEKRRNK